MHEVGRMQRELLDGEEAGPSKAASVEAVVLGDESEGAELLRPLRELGPLMDTFAMVPPVGIAELHMDPPEPLPYTGGAGMMLREIDAAAIEAFVAAAGPGSGSPLVSAEIRHVGGELARPRPGHGALGTFDAAFLTFGLGIVVDDDSYRANRAQLALLEQALAPYDTGRQYLNFTEEARGLPAPARRQGRRRPGQPLRGQLPNRPRRLARP